MARALVRFFGSPPDIARRWIGTGREDDRARTYVIAALGLVLACAIGCAGEPPRSLLVAGEVFSQVRLSKTGEAEPSTLRLDRLRDGAAAWNTGFRSGDYVLSVNELPVYSYQGGLYLLSRVDAAIPTVIEVNRGGQILRIEIPVAQQ